MFVFWQDFLNFCSIFHYRIQSFYCLIGIPTFCLLTDPTSLQVRCFSTGPYSLKTVISIKNTCNLFMKKGIPLEVLDPPSINRFQLLSYSIKYNQVFWSKFLHVLKVPDYMLKSSTLINSLIIILVLWNTFWFWSLHYWPQTELINVLYQVTFSLKMCLMSTNCFINVISVSRKYCEIKGRIWRDKATDSWFQVCLP